MKIPSYGLFFNLTDEKHSHTSLQCLTKTCEHKVPTFTPEVETVYLYFTTCPPLHGEVFISKSPQSPHIDLGMPPPPPPPLGKLMTHA